MENDIVVMDAPEFMLRYDRALRDANNLKNCYCLMAVRDNKYFVVENTLCGSKKAAKRMLSDRKYNGESFKNESAVKVSTAYKYLKSNM